MTGMKNSVTWLVREPDSTGEPVGASGLRQVIEIVLQLQGRAGGTVPVLPVSAAATAVEGALRNRPVEHAQAKDDQHDGSLLATGESIMPGRMSGRG